jgi:DNA polymerase-1
MVAATGRLSSSRPNLQNIPVRTSWGREIRQAFIPCKAGDLFLCGDYSQVELRILAHLSKDEKLLEAFERGEDIHRLTASEIFGVTPEEVTGEMRRTAKVVNFGIIYGMSAHGLSQTLKIPRNEAGRYINIYLERFQGVHKFIENTVAGAAETGFVSTLLGRRRRVDGIRSRNATVRKNAGRIAVNAPVQGSAADLIKVAMIRMQDEIEKRGLAGRMVLQVHDELVFEVPPEEVEIFSELARETMEKAYDLCPPLRITLKSGKNWGELEALPDA